MKRLLVIAVVVLVIIACGSESALATPTRSNIQLTFTAVSVQVDAAGTKLAAALTQPPATETPTPAPTASAGNTRDNPLPGPAGVDIGGDMILTVLGVQRPANAEVEAGNMFNSTPAAGLEYATVKIQVDCHKATNDKCTFTPMELKSVGSDGQVHDMEFVAGLADQMEEFSYEFFGGSKVGGLLVFLFPKGDEHVVLFHEALFFGSPVYFSLR